MGLACPLSMTIRPSSLAHAKDLALLYFLDRSLRGIFPFKPLIVLLSGIWKPGFREETSALAGIKTEVYAETRRVRGCPAVLSFPGASTMVQA